jgi:2-methylaconitate cis-trans-isomerase PrpF
MGGGVSSLSKCVIVSPSQREDIDIDYTFIQIAIDQPVVDWSNNCGNLSSAVGPFAVNEGLVKVKDGEVTIKIYQTNTDKVIHSTFNVTNGFADPDGDYKIAGCIRIWIKNKIRLFRTWWIWNRVNFYLREM